mgnify:FL=1
MKKLIFIALALLLVSISGFGIETYQQTISRLEGETKQLSAQLADVKAENAAIKEKIDALVPKTGTASKTAMASKVSGEITLDGYADEWEQAVAFKADPMYSGDSFDVIPKSVLWMAWDAKNL